MGEIRIVAGAWRGRLLRTWKTEAVGLRPTAIRVRTSLFDRLSPILPGSRVLDLFAGSGALGFEALSRGAAEVVFVEKSTPVLRVLDRNVETLGAKNAAVLGDDVFRCLTGLRRTEPFDLILADPPYESGLAPRLLGLLDENPALRTAGLLVVEHSRREPLPETAGALEFVDERRYGDTVLTFYRRR